MAKPKPQTTTGSSSVEAPSVGALYVRVLRAQDQRRECSGASTETELKRLAFLDTVVEATVDELADAIARLLRS